VITLLWDVIAARSFERETNFEMAARDIRTLPKLEWTVQVNIALIAKSLANYFFHPAEYPEIPRQDQAGDDELLFRQGPARGLGQIRFQDYHPTFERFDLPNVRLFRDQISIFQELLATATPDATQQKDIDFLLALGEIFTLIVYGQLILENVATYRIDDDLVDQIFDVLVRDLSRHALTLHGKPSSTAEQETLCLRMLRRPAADPARFGRVWEQQVAPLKDAYEMNAQARPDGAAAGGDPCQHHAANAARTIGARSGG
jgi:acyl-CoA dehydrogenase